MCIHTHVVLFQLTWWREPGDIDD